MANYTNHYNLTKPLQSEHYDVDVANANNDIIDEALHKKVDSISGKGLSTNDFTDFHRRKVDSYAMPFNFRGNVATYNDLPNTSTNGYVYGVLDTKHTYVWNSELSEWVDLGEIMDTSILVSADDVYLKNETYNKNEVYSKSQTYNKTELDAKILEWEVVDEWE